MTESFWWYLLAGFFIGFGISTLWEWLYFRRKRMTIRDRRIAELEAALRTYASATEATQANAVDVDDWGDPQFVSPLVYLETEETAPSANTQSEPTPPADIQPAPSVLVAASAAMNAPHTPPPSAPSQPQPVAVSQTPVMDTADTHIQPSLTGRSMPVEATTSVNTVVAAHHAVAAQSQPAESSTASVPNNVAGNAAYRHAVAVSYANGHVNQPQPAHQQPAPAPATSHPISSQDLDALASSINELIQAINRSSTEMKQSPAVEQRSQTIASNEAALTRAEGRVERIFVRLVRSMAHFLRQVRTILFDRETADFATVTRNWTSASDELTLIDGLTHAHAERLRVAGVTTFARLAALSDDELRLITLSPDGSPVDVEPWRTQAAHLAGMKAGQ